MSDSNFPDGEKFIPHNNHIDDRGEVFTPPDIVLKMIDELGIFEEVGFEIFNKKTVKFNKNITTRQIIDTLKKRVYEPAVGTGNIIATILFYKLELVKLLKEKLNKDDLVLTSIASCYANDIDDYNVEYTKKRLLNLIPTHLKGDAKVIVDANIIKFNSLNNNEVNKVVWRFYSDFKNKRAEYTSVKMIDQMPGQKEFSIFN